MLPQSERADANNTNKFSKMKAYIMIKESRQAGGSIEVKSRSISLLEVDELTLVFCDQIAAIAPFVPGHVAIFLNGSNVQLVTKGTRANLIDLISDAYHVERMQQFDEP